ncbi:MAG: FAD:protein FMN transferase [Rhodocyclaceae bacterium]|nr:FAD:protein FMN transferase [Rhodocyclaceae bacterium]
MQHFRFPFRAMACENTIELFAPTFEYAESVANIAIDEVRRIEQKYSRYREDSVLTGINQASRHATSAAWTEIDAETSQLLDFADSCFQQSSGLFDITTGVLRRVWDFKSGQLPSQQAIEELLPLVGWRHVKRRLNAIQLTRSGMEIDFGGFGKEYAADRAAAVLLASGVAHGFVDLGGDVVVTGPQFSGAPWTLGIRHPRQPGTVLATVEIASGAVATSGDYERFMEIDGVRYCHILDPRSGQPTIGLQSVTVFAPSCLVAGAITTIAMLKGSHGGGWLATVLTDGLRGLVVDQLGRVCRY